MDAEQIINSTPVRTIVDGNSDVFRYGIFRYDGSGYEDPTYLGFTIEIDQKTALFQEVRPFLEKHGANRVEHNSRIPVYDEFVNRVVSIFNSQESVSGPDERSVFIKSHYINSVSGLDLLSKKFIDWREDALTLELHEDVAMYTTYLTRLYNDLIYSYETGRQMLPENLLKFNLHIKVSEIRNLTSIGRLLSNDATDQEVAIALKNNVTCITYKLHDCEFDMFESAPHADQILQGGIDSPHPAHSTVPLKIYFKSVSRRIYAPLIKGSIALNDNRSDLGVVIVGYNGDRSRNGQVPDNSSVTLNADGTPKQPGGPVTGASDDAPEAFLNAGAKKPSAISTYNAEVGRNSEIVDPLDLSTYFDQMGEIDEYNAQLAPTFDGAGPVDADTNIGGFDFRRTLANPQQSITDLANRVGKNALETVERRVSFAAGQLLQKAKDAINKRRAELVNKFVNDVKAKVGLNKIEPANVNEENFAELLRKQRVEQIGKTLGTNLLGDLVRGSEGLGL